SVWPGQVSGGGSLTPGEHRVRVEAADSSGASARWSGRVTLPDGRPGEPAQTRLEAESSAGSFRLELPRGTLHAGPHVALVADDAGVAIEPSWETPRPGARLLFRPAAGTPADRRRRLGLYRGEAAESGAPDAS